MQVEPNRSTSLGRFGFSLERWGRAMQLSFATIGRHGTQLSQAHARRGTRSGKRRAIQGKGMCGGNLDSLQVKAGGGIRSAIRPKNEQARNGGTAASLQGDFLSLRSPWPTASADRSCPDREHRRPCRRAAGRDPDPAYRKAVLHPC